MPSICSLRSVCCSALLALSCSDTVDPLSPVAPGPWSHETSSPEKRNGVDRPLTSVREGFLLSGDLSMRLAV